MNGKELVKNTLSSTAWRLACDWGEPRAGHPEGTVGRHVTEQLIPFIDRWYAHLPDYDDLVALAYLHDIGKPITKYVDGRLVSESHSILSARIAEELDADERLVQVILSNDRAYSHWRKLLDKDGVWQSARWTGSRREMFVEEFGRGNLDLSLLVLFHRADNAYRRPALLDEATDSVYWFENKLIELGLVRDLPAPGKDCKIAWSQSV